MSARYEQSIVDWYEGGRTANLEHLDLANVDKPKLSHLAHNIDVIYDRLLLHSKVTIKDFYEITKILKETKHDQLEISNKISKDFKNIRSHIASVDKRINTLEGEVAKIQVNLERYCQGLFAEITASKPLTKKQVLDLVNEIAQQPKLVEEQALKLTEELNRKLHSVELLLHEVKSLIA